MELQKAVRTTFTGSLGETKIVLVAERENQLGKIGGC
jgi:hypothetical protein